LEEKMLLTPVILAGGSGTRLWPLSRQLYPKQFLPLLGVKTLLQQTIERLQGLDCQAPIVVCNEEHRFLAAEQLRQTGIDDGAIILEPVPKNTAPAIALAAHEALRRDEEAMLLVLPADHLIEDTASFHAAVKKALAAAKEGNLVTFGIVPHRPETGYGYIRRGREQSKEVFSVLAFVEKPDEATAKEYLKTGEYYWNSGMFLFGAKDYLEELERHAPDMADSCEKAFSRVKKDLDFLRIDEKAFATCPKDSIDYAVMEKTKKAMVVPLDAGWNDIGSWASLHDVCPKDENKNCVTGDVLTEDTENCLVRSESRLVAAAGLKDVIIVETKDAVLVIHKDSAQDIKTLVEKLEAEGKSEHINHREVYRPWGSYDSLERGERFQVKRIIVKPGARISTQMHYHRAEHWIVVRGTAKVTIDGETVLLTENESTFIPVGKMHILENPGKIPLELIEVQSGTYLGEDDIVRFEDKYGKT
jgi:mannose-1-phosphate guanylyltransferase